MIINIISYSTNLISKNTMNIINNNFKDKVSYYTEDFNRERKGNMINIHIVGSEENIEPDIRNIYIIINKDILIASNIKNHEMHKKCEEFKTTGNKTSIVTNINSKKINDRIIEIVANILKYRVCTLEYGENKILCFIRDKYYINIFNHLCVTSVIRNIESKENGIEILENNYTNIKIKDKSIEEILKDNIITVCDKSMNYYKIINYNDDYIFYSYDSKVDLNEEKSSTVNMVNNTMINSQLRPNSYLDYLSGKYFRREVLLLKNFDITAVFLFEDFNLEIVIEYNKKLDKIEGLSNVVFIYRLLRILPSYSDFRKNMKEKLRQKYSKMIKNIKGRKYGYLEVKDIFP